MILQNLAFSKEKKPILVFLDHVILDILESPITKVGYLCSGIVHWFLKSSSCLCMLTLSERVPSSSEVSGVLVWVNIMS